MKEKYIYSNCVGMFKSETGSDSEEEAIVLFLLKDEKRLIDEQNSLRKLLKQKAREIKKNKKELETYKEKHPEFFL